MLISYTFGLLPIRGCEEVERGWKPWPIHERNYNYWIKQGWMSTNRQVISWPRYNMFIVWGEPIQFQPSAPDDSLSECLKSIARWMQQTLSTSPQSDTHWEPRPHSNLLYEPPTMAGKRIQEAPSSNTIRYRSSGGQRVRDISYMRSQEAA